MEILILLLLASVVLIAVFIYQVRKFNARLASEGEEESETGETSAQPYEAAFLGDLNHAIEKGLKKVIVQAKSEDDSPAVQAAELQSALDHHLATAISEGASLLRTALEQDMAQTLLVREGERAVYLLAMPLHGDRPYLIRQTDGFSFGLAHHVDRVFAQLQSGSEQISLLLVALFWKPGAKEGTVYVGYRDAKDCLLPISLLSNSEISRFSSALSNFRQII